ncbi:lipase class 3 family protein [Musa troglodytarum]|uniref:Lipase class 3 family protein n=1 Tax=Musa troglodytarum TaxID=320322 RepID=A0A9E7EYF6_9LILI|nr:lipase class 3 family protein [Musa troglodytarum]
MATATMATAAGAAALLYYTLKWKLHAGRFQENGQGEHDQDASKPILSGRNRVSQRPAQAPATWLETISTLSETLRFTYSETLGKWPIGDLAFGINFLLKRQGNLHVASIYAGEESVPLKGAEIVAELKYLLNLLNLCWHFSKKPFPLFLEATGYSQDDVLLQKPKAGILKPAFTILTDKSTKSILLLIRGTHSIRDTLTAATGAVVPFHHTLLYEGGISDLILGYAHCGMVAAARSIAKLATPCLLETLHEYPDYKLKIVGHSLGGGTAALLTYILREQQEFATAICVTFAPAACMTWELAESGRHFITSIINGADLVPSFSAASVDDLRSEVTASAWLNDLRNQIEQTRILSTVYRSASALGSRLPSIASARARVAGAGAILRPVSNGTQVVMTRAKSVAQAALSRPPLRISSWSCIGPRYRNKASFPITRREESIEESSMIAKENGETLATLTETTTVETTEITTQGVGWTSDLDCSHSSAISHADGPLNTDISDDEDATGQCRNEDSMTEYDLWQQLENELNKPRQNEEVDIDNEIREEENAAAAAHEEVEDTSEDILTETREVRRFYPPGKIMHIVIFPSEETTNEEDSGMHHDGENPEPEYKTGIFLTPRSLYGKLRLSQSMINDHFMPIYRRNIERLISILEKDTFEDGHGDEAML